MIVVDASALVSIGDDEPDKLDFIRCLQGADTAHIAHLNYVEAGIILMSGSRLPDRTAYDRWLSALGVSLCPSDDLGPAALDAYLRFGRRRHPAKLNLADCFAYALAMQLDAPLLFKGDDFLLTDVKRAI